MAGSGISFRALSENSDGTPAADPVTLTPGDNAFIGMDSVKTAGCPRAQIAYFNDFDGGLAVAPGVKDVLDGITTTEPVQGYSGVGSFGGDFLRNTTGGDHGSGCVRPIPDAR